MMAHYTTGREADKISGRCLGLDTPTTNPYNGAVDDSTLISRVTTTYLGDNRVSIAAGNRHFVADRRTCLDRPEAGFCPLELVAAALGA